MSETNPSSEDDNAPSAGSSRRGSRWVLVGWILIGCSGLFFFAICAIPFLPLGAGIRWGLALVTYVLMQVSWWAGTVFLGPAAIRSMKGWFKRKSSVQTQTVEMSESN